MIERGGALLLERRSGCERRGLVGGGSVEVDEALRCEVREETGLVMKYAGLFRVFSDPFRIVRLLDGNVARLISPSTRWRLKVSMDCLAATSRRGCGSSAARNFRRWTRWRWQDLLSWTGPRQAHTPAAKRRGFEVRGRRRAACDLLSLAIADTARPSQRAIP